MTSPITASAMAAEPAPTTAADGRGAAGAARRAARSITVGAVTLTAPDARVEAAVQQIDRAG